MNMPTTTREVRSVFAGQREEFGAVLETAEAEFDHWLAQVQADAAAQALVEFADAHRMPQVLFRRGDGSAVYVGDLLRERATAIRIAAREPDVSEETDHG